VEIRETIFKKSFSLDTSDPYGFSMDFMRKLSNSFRVYKKKNIYETSGPVKKSILVFDVVQTIDKFSYIVINFSMESENSTLYVDAAGEYVVFIRDKGFFASIFTEFYLNNVFPQLRKISGQKIKEIEAEIAQL
jgi:hypothetical protein